MSTMYGRPGVPDAVVNRVQPLASILTYMGPKAADEMKAFWEVEPGLIPADLSHDQFRHFGRDERLAMALCSPWAALNVFEKSNEPQRRLLRSVLETNQAALPLRELKARGADLESLKEEFAPLLNSGVLTVCYGPRIQHFDFTTPHRKISPDHYLVVIPNLIRPLETASDLTRLASDDILRVPLRRLVLGLDSYLTGRAMGLDINLIRSYINDHASILAANLEEPECVRALLEQLSPSARELFDRIAKEGAPVCLDSLFPGLSRAARLPQLMELHDRGLIFPAFPGEKQACYAHPAVVAATKGTGTSLPPLSDTMAPAQDPHDVDSAASHFLWNAVVIADWLDSGGAALTSSSEQVPKRIVKQLDRVIAHSGWRVSSRLELVSYTVGWLLCSNLAAVDDIRLSLTKAGKDWMKKSAEEQSAILMANWLNEADTRHYWASKVVNFSDPVAPPILRTRLLSMLRELPAGTWFRTYDFGQRLLAREPRLLRSEQTMRRLAGAAADRYLREAWFKFEGLLLIIELCNLPYQVGLVDVGWDAT
ncbi:MAG TPA: hypothetical protein VFJ58_22720, partial [Armatimonadota bacterium]|nr:hypothetical protein [Armatimonadota bacterium]